MLPAATSRVWEALRTLRELGGFTLIGGTALAMHISHRISEDLDFVYAGERLPSDRLDVALRALNRAGYASERRDSPAALAEFEDTGLKLRDYQQDYLIDGMKVSFFVADAGLERVLSNERTQGPRLATVAEIFAAKCLVTAKRSRVRDWFDLYVLLRDHGFTLRDYVDVFSAAGDARSAELGLTRLCGGRPELADEGFKALLAAPPSLDEMRSFFRERRDELEVELAKEKFEGAPPRPPWTPGGPRR